MSSEDSANKKHDVSAQKVGELVDENKYFYNEDESIPAIELLFGSHIGNQVLEIGSGTGAIAHWLVQRGASVTAVEPEPVLAKKISLRFSSSDDIEVIIGGSVDAYRQLAESKKVFDTVIYLNVMEHIADDLGEFNKAKAVLKPGGKLLVYV
ncbi:MAG: class I SAM-dependent methyltransferase, partial [Actinobacteria bacterium]|nr:class I SAM-dependent methyltransferase [Actinomycetota bacterium]